MDLQKTVFWLAKGRQSHAKMPSFRRRKTAFCKATHNALIISILQKRFTKHNAQAAVFNKI